MIQVMAANALLAQPGTRRPSMRAGANESMRNGGIDMNQVLSRSRHVASGFSMVGLGVAGIAPLGGPLSETA